MKLPEVHLGHTVWSYSVLSAVFSNVVAVEQLIDDATLHILSTGEPCKLKKLRKILASLLHSHVLFGWCSPKANVDDEKKDFIGNFGIKG
jgi:hypothetical protein